MRILAQAAQRFMKPPEHAAEIVLWMMFDRVVAGVSGKYFDQKYLIPSSPESENQEDWKRLWELSGQLAPIPEEVK